MKNAIRCPVCGVEFDPRTPVCHISKHHKGATEHQLRQIRDARRQHFYSSSLGADGKSTPLV